MVHHTSLQVFHHPEWLTSLGRSAFMDNQPAWLLKNLAWLPMLGIRNLSPHLRNSACIADNQIDCGVAD
jgi:hypothetical protein